MSVEPKFVFLVPSSCPPHPLVFRDMTGINCKLVCQVPASLVFSSHPMIDVMIVSCWAPAAPPSHLLIDDATTEQELLDTTPTTPTRNHSPLPGRSVNLFLPHETEGTLIVVTSFFSVVWGGVVGDSGVHVFRGNRSSDKLKKHVMEERWKRV